ncbi:hypothetical protein RhiirA4_456092 [Rhizophagus irregularis]|uniref:Uncharacterized protein n=1 Tax=Rhizophagus irregularis TaxID=588596 RepID=A0A2I1G6X4_9GLOM|nr:hypothetical protein RhiirA4_456092 [Rhizophagus irregularis]
MSNSPIVQKAITNINVHSEIRYNGTIRSISKICQNIRYIKNSDISRNYSRGRPSSEDVCKHFEKLRKTPRQKCVIIVKMTLVMDLIDRLEDYII